MDSVSQNGILKDAEFSKFKERTVKLRFMQQISYGVGAAMVFGVFTGAAGMLFKAAFTTAAEGAAVAAATVISTPAVAALATIATLGIGLIYLSAKFMSENTLLEQDFQAKKIGAAARGPVIAQQPELEIKTSAFPAQQTAVSADMAPPAAAKPVLVVNKTMHDGRVTADRALVNERS